MKHFPIFSIFFMLILGCNQPNYKKEAIELNNKGSEFFLQNKKDSALIYFTLAAEKNPQYEIALQNKVNALIALHLYEQAVSAIDHLLAKNEYPEAYEIKGILLETLEKNIEAKEAFQAALFKRKDRIKHTGKEKLPLENYALGMTYILLGDTIIGKKLMIENSEAAKALPSITDSILINASDRNKLLKPFLK